MGNGVQKALYSVIIPRNFREVQEYGMIVYEKIHVHFSFLGLFQKKNVENHFSTVSPEFHASNPKCRSNRFV
jgi:hypothetical protein